MTPPQEPIDMLAGAPQEQPMQAADGGIVPPPVQPWQQEVYGGAPPQPPAPVMSRQTELPQFAQPPTPIEALTTDIMTQPYQPHPDDMPPQPIAPSAPAPVAPAQPTPQVAAPAPAPAPAPTPAPQQVAPAQEAQPEQAQPEQKKEGTDYLSLLTGSPKGSGVLGAVGSTIGSGLGALAMAADPDTALEIDKETRGREERKEARNIETQRREQERLEKAYNAQQERLQKQADESRKREQQLACLLYTSPSPRDRQKSRMPSSA